jgi:hypothetical protein
MLERLAKDQHLSNVRIGWRWLRAKNTLAFYLHKHVIFGNITARKKNNIF